MEEKYNYKIVFELKDDIKDDELKRLNENIENLKGKFHIKQVGDNEFRRLGNNPTIQDDFGDVAVFYCLLEYDYKNYFKKLECHDIPEGTINVAV